MHELRRAWSSCPQVQDEAGEKVIFKNITKACTIISMTLWVMAAILLGYSTASFGIVGVLAAFAQIIAVQSAKREAVIKERRRWFVDKLLDELGDDRE